MSTTTLMEAPMLMETPALVTKADLVQEKTSLPWASSLGHRLLYGLGVALVILLIAGGVSDLIVIAAASNDTGHNLVRAAFALTVGPFMLLHCFRATDRLRQ